MQNFNMQSVDSSQIGQVGYDPQSLTLRIKYNSGGVYDYAGVPQAKYDALMNAESLGKYFHGEIRGNFSYTKVQ